MLYKNKHLLLTVYHWSNVVGIQNTHRYVNKTSPWNFQMMRILWIITIGKLYLQYLTVLWKNWNIYNGSVMYICITMWQGFGYEILAKIILNIISSIENEKPNKIFLIITRRILISRRFSKPIHFKNHIFAN